MTAALLVLLGSPATSMAASGSPSKVRPHERGGGGAARRPPKPRGFLRKMLCRGDCARRRAGSTRAASTATAIAPRPVGPRRFGSAAELPPPRFGTVRLYRGTGHPDRVQVSRSQRGRPAAEVPRGDQHFFDPIRAGAIAHQHAAGAEMHPDAVSLTSDLFTAQSVAREHKGAVLVYDIPADQVERMPRGDRTMGEHIAMYSVPNDYLIGVLPAAPSRKNPAR